MANDSSTDYTLTTAELPAVRTLLFVQQQFGMGTAAPTLDAYGKALDTLLAAYPQVQNTVVKSWFNQLFDYLNATATLAPEINVPVWHMLWHYYGFCNRQVVLCWRYNSPHPWWWVSFWDTFVNGRQILFDGVGGIPSDNPPQLEGNQPTIGPWPVLASPASWNKSITNQLKTWGENPPATFVNNFIQLYQIDCCFVLMDGSCHMCTENAANGLPVYYEQEKILQGWANLGTVASQTAQTPAATQRANVLDLLKPGTLTADAYFFLLHVLLGLAVTTVDNQTLVQTVVKTTTTSPEYPNDTFVNQLVYLVLMHLADPLGDFAMTNTQLQVLLANLNALITATDGASTACKQSLNNHIKILRADTAYPMQDPYNSNFGFNTRVADTLAALDAARSTIVLSAAFAARKI